MDRKQMERLKKAIVEMQCDQSVEYKDMNISLPGEQEVTDRRSELLIRLEEIKSLTALHLEPRSDRPVIGKPYNLLKRFLARMLRWLYLPVMKRQTEVNECVAEELRLISQKLSEMEDILYDR